MEAGKSNAIFAEPIDAGRPNLSTKASRIGEAQVVRNNDMEIGPLSRGHSQARTLRRNM
jgi:hypothetical protein